MAGRSLVPSQVFLSLGLRPLFPGAAGFAALAMLLWIAELVSPGVLPARPPPLLWHIHEMLFGYLAAVIAGFLLTAVPSWTGRQPVTGIRLALLCLVWLLARLANILLPVSLPTIIVDCAFLLLLSAYLWVQILAANNHRNLVVAAVITVLALAHVAWYRELHVSGFPATTLRIILAALACLLVIIGGRLAPNFSRNWLVGRNVQALPAAAGRFDSLCVSLTVVALICWCVLPGSFLTGVGLVLISALNALRLARWRGWATRQEPLVLILHLGYLWLPVAFALLGLATLRPDLISSGAATHALTAGAAGVMTIAVMTRATLGHTGRALQADRVTTLIYLCIFVSAALRVASAIFASGQVELHLLAGLLWFAGFSTFCLKYGRYCLAPRV